MPESFGIAPAAPVPKAGWRAYARGGMHAALQVGPLRWSMMRLVLAFPSAARAIAARIGYLPTVELHIIVSRPPQWRIDPAPRTVDAWREIVRRRRGS